MVSQASVDDIDLLSQIDYRVVGSFARLEELARFVHEGKVWVARIADLAVGFVIVDQSFFGKTFIHLLIVDIDYRRRGVGSHLVQYVESYSLTEKLFTSTNQSNIKMKRLCESLGFIKSGYIENLDEGDPEIVYFKRVIQK